MSMRSLLLVALLGACGPTITLTDDIDLTWDFGPSLSRFDDSLHSPYVKGAPMTVYVTSNDKHPNLTGWSVVSSDPSIFEIDHITTDSFGAYAHGMAVGAGTATLTVLDDHGQEVGIGEAEVLAPDRVELDAHGYLILDRDAEAPVNEARIVAGGTATYLTRYFKGDRELHGNSVLTVDAPASITAEPQTSFLFENREWLTLTSSSPGTSTIQLLADGDPVQTVSVVTVPETDITGIALIAQPENDHHDGDWLVDLAQAYDADGQRIYGVDYTWTVNGVSQVFPGDLYRYEFKGGSFEAVIATRGSHSASATIQSDKGFVDSTNNVGCSAGGGAGGFGLVMVGLVGLRLRRQRRAK